MVLLDGGLPYIDTVELKAPGTFYLASLVAPPEGRGIEDFQCWANLWATAGMLATAGLAWSLWGRRAAVATALLVVLHAGFLDSMDANYVTWTLLPQVLAMTMALLATRSQSIWRTLLLWGVAGLFAAIATLFKRPAGVVLIVLIAWALFGGRGARKQRHLQGAASVLLGFAAGHAPIALHYGMHGELAGLVDGYVLNQWGSRYVSARHQPLLAELRDGVFASAYFLGLPLAMAAFTVMASLRDPKRRRETTWVLVWLLAALGSAAVGMRFYQGYFLTALPPVCLLAAAPWGLLGSRFSRGKWTQIILIAPLLVLFLRQSWMLEGTRKRRGLSRDQGAQAVANHIKNRTVDGEKIWVWGWHLWGVYSLADRRSASAIYKSWGLLTTPNDNTWRRSGTRSTFVDGPAAAKLLDDFETDPPAYIVLGSSVPHRDFSKLHRFIQERYSRDRSLTLGRVQFWRHLDPPVSGNGPQ